MNTQQLNIHTKALNISLWLAQAFIAFAFIAIGYIKFSTPIIELSKNITWAADFPVAFVRSIGLIDIAGGIGILFPALLRIKPKLSVLAALCCCILQVCAITFHFSRGEQALTTGNFVFLVTCLFILWGRTKKLPFAVS